MRSATRLVPAGAWPRAEERDCITLPYDERHRRRVRLVADRGTEFLLDLPEAVVMREGDGLALEGGGYVLVRAAAEELVEVRAGAAPAAPSFASREEAGVSPAGAAPAAPSFASREEAGVSPAGAAVSLARLAWHLGNRHLPVEISAERILIHRDHVIEDMLRGLGAVLRPVRAPFNPESGAYADDAAHRHAHAHGHDHDHDHAHGHHHHGEER